MRFPAPRGVIGLACVFVFASGLFMLFLLLNPSSLKNAFDPSQKYHLSKVYDHVFINSSFSPPHNTPHSTNSSTTHETSREQVSSAVNVNASVSSGEGAKHDQGVESREGSGLTLNQSNEKADFSEKGVHPPDDGVGKKVDSGLTPNHIDQKTDFSQNGVHAPDHRAKPDDGVAKKQGSLLTPNQSDQNSPTGRTKPPHKKPLTSSNAKKGTKNVKKSQHGKRLRKKKKKKCDMFEGSWVRDDSYPLYKAGSCPHIDEPFNCFLNGRSDNLYEKFRWQPKDCNLPRLNARNMLEILRGKRLVYVGDSLNRNMWESLVCILGNSLQDKSRVFEASGREEFRTENSYSFIFKDYNCSIEFVRSTFLVQEWETTDHKGSTKETLRLDLFERSCDKYKNADVVIFNTGHWWTHEKRVEGKEYYQEGDHIHGQLNVEEAFHKALLTWAKWVDTNIDPKKTIVFFRGYSPSHFMGGEWNSGGRCENDTKPLKNESTLSESPPMMRTIESVVKGMKTPVFYLNVTEMTDLRRDAHPSFYRFMNMTEETKRHMLTNQDCSHWCLPGVPDLWNEIVYAHLLHSMKRKKGSPKT